MRTVAVLSLLLLTSCLTPREVPPTVAYDVDPEITVTTVEKTDRSLAIRELAAGPPYQKTMVYRQDAFELVQYPSAQWADAPSELVTDAIMDAVIATERFADVGEANDVPLPDLMLTGRLRKFEEIRENQTRQAVCEVRLALRTAMEGELLWSDTLAASVELTDPTIPALAAAMNRAVGEVASRAAQAIAEH
jgi:ABC-type uncharacterized transport system auxiliary subunit